MKKVFKLILPMMAAFTVLTGCGEKNADETAQESVQQTQVETTAETEAETTAEMTEASASESQEESTAADETSGAEKTEASLPPYRYNGDDPAEAAITDYMINYSNYYVPDGAVLIPAFRIFRSEAVNDTDTKVYGNFWVFCYSLKGKTLFTESGGAAPGVVTVRTDSDGLCSVVSFDAVTSGAGIDEDIKRICAGDTALEEEFRISGDITDGPAKNDRERYLISYIKDNQLDVDSYQDEGWDPVQLNKDSIPEARTEKTK